MLDRRLAVQGKNKTFQKKKTCRKNGRVVISYFYFFNEFNSSRLTKSQILISFLVCLFLSVHFSYFHPLLLLLITLYSMQLDATS